MKSRKRHTCRPSSKARGRHIQPALIEPSFDFDPNDLRTLAVEDGDGYLLNGEKTYVPYAEPRPDAR